jgi:hypothetical protein
VDLGTGVEGQSKIYFWTYKDIVLDFHDGLTSYCFNFLSLSRLLHDEGTHCFLGRGLAFVVGVLYRLRTNTSKG